MIPFSTKILKVATIGSLCNEALILPELRGAAYSHSSVSLHAEDKEEKMMPRSTEKVTHGTGTTPEEAGDSCSCCD